ncbi:phosphatase PAP2 family protein [Adhaeribacter soli]|uniref:Phosphatase PAP2 family protein n=1 Tax=Adhaeribacter soli TaxID=2607655 RepID=A0A5N1J6G1_9BACT|nr:phosphatase PAP2 family protein [Adhaeribacter soli]KAA9345713.1 phosphatase PAP2 family protein [Adhaeribacter soli]
MQHLYRWWLSVLFIILFCCTNLQAQQTDTLQKYQDPLFAPKEKAPFYKSKVFKATIVPAILIGYGVSTVRDNGFYSSYDAREDILREFPNFDTWLDDAFLVAPYVELAAANLFNQRSNNDLLNTTLVILKAEALFAVTVFGLKEITNLERPNGENMESMPSGHTAQAFLAASILHTELKHRSNWYGVAGYGIATSVGAFRMLKNKHWQSDVFVGAGIGILCSHAAYLSHRNRWGRKPTIVMAPTYLYGVPGISLALNFDAFNQKKQPVRFAE